jgi:A/G-specific adenine glycosylase
VPRPLVPPARRAALRRRLLAWWDEGHRELPWRFPEGAADPYRVWLSEVMLQQTRVETAAPYYRRFVEAWPTLHALAAARDDDVFAAWSGLGYYARCRNLLAAARATLARHGGLPASLPALRALPGFGPYTAGAVASIAFGVPAAAVDGNAARALVRLFAVEGDPAGGAARERIWRTARELAGEGPGADACTQRAGDWTQALIELGARICGRSPGCGRCPVEALCEARRAGLERAIPPPRRRQIPRRLTLACAVIERRGRVLLERRPAGGLFAGLLALPCAEVPDGEVAEASLAAALRAAGIRATVGDERAAVERLLTHRTLQLVAYGCRARGAISAEAGPRGGWVWIPWADLPAAGLPTAMRALLDGLGTFDREPAGPPRIPSRLGVEKGPSRGWKVRPRGRSSGQDERP